MAEQPYVDQNALMVRGMLALGLGHRRFGELLGTSERTSQRRAAGLSHPTTKQLATLARHVHARDAVLAARIANAIGESLESLGIVAPPPPAPEPAPPPPVVQLVPVQLAPPPEQLAELVVCALADAMDVSPRVTRPLLRTAFARARDLGVDLASAAVALAPPPEPPTPPVTPNDPHTRDATPPRTPRRRSR
jgi:hypothetical protein